MRRRIIAVFKWSKTVALTVLSVLSLLLSSCVDVEQYELYDDDLDEVVVLRNKKSKDDTINMASDEARRLFDNTCFMISACVASTKNDNIGGYIDNLDNFVRNKRGDILKDILKNSTNQDIDDSNRKYIVENMFGTSITSPQNGANHGEMLELLGSLTELSYTYVDLGTAEAITNFIQNHKKEHSTPHHFLFWDWETPIYDDEQYVIKTSIGSGVGHVFNYDGNRDDLGLLKSPTWGRILSAPSGSYVGVYYPAD